MPTNSQPQIVTASELFEFPSDGLRYELIRGALQMMSPAGGRHGRIAYRIGQILGNHIDYNKLGFMFAAETGFKIATEPDTVLAPDVAFVSRARYDEVADDSGYLPFAPDLAVEVLSPSDRFTRVEAKAIAWLDGGCKLVLIVDPESESITAYCSRQSIQIFGTDETLDCSDAVPNWSLSLPQIFHRQ